MHGTLGREHLWVKVHNMISQKIMNRRKSSWPGNNKIPLSGYVRYSYPGQGALFIPCSGYVPFLVPWPWCTAHTLLRVPWSGYEYGTYPDLGPGRQNQSYARYPEQGMTSVWPISWSYTGVDWPGYATGFAVQYPLLALFPSIPHGQNSLWLWRCTAQAFNGPLVFFFSL